MQVASLLTLEELSDSLYAAALRESADRSLRFVPDLEAQYRTFTLENSRRLIQTGQVLTLLIVLALALLRLVAAPSVDETIWTRVIWFLLVPICCAVTAVTWTERYTRWYRPVARVAMPIIATVLAASAAQSFASGHIESVVGLGVAMLAADLLIGALLLEGLILNTCVLAGFALGTLFSGGLDAGAWPLLATLLGLAGVGALASYSVEVTNRRHFLEQGLLREMAWRDGLTGLKNRRAFDDHLASMWRQAARDKDTIGLLLIDLDHFKAYNDACGHQRGDDCLRRVSQVIEKMVRRPFDMAARYGGEELVVVLYQMGSERTQATGEEIRRAVERLRIDHPQAQASPFVTVSVGAACVRPSIDRSPQGLVQLADEALYTAKQKGRNCVYFQQAEYATMSTGNFRRPVAPANPDEASGLDKVAGD
jgi:diguanylate cyclase (GGDEF)-like protein